MRFRGSNSFANNSTVNLGNSTGSTGGRFEFGADGVLGSGTLAATGGGGGGFSLIPYDPSGTNGITRTLTNATVGFGLSITFGDTLTASRTNSLVFTGTTFLGASAGTRTYTVNLTTNTTNPVLSTSALRFNGPTALRGSGASVAGTVLFQGTGRVEFNGLLSNGDAGNNGTAANLTVGSGGGPTTVRLAGAANTYSGLTTLQSGGLIVAADAPATGAGALGTPAVGNESVTVGRTAASTIPRLLLLDVTAGPVNFGRPVNILTFDNATPATILGVTGTGSSIGTFTNTAGTSAINIGSAGGFRAPLSLSTLSAGSTAQFNATIQRSGGYTGNVDILINANSTGSGFVGTGTVSIGGTQSPTLNAQTGVSGGTLQVATGTSFDTGRGFFVGSGTAVVDGTLTQNTTPVGAAPLGTVRVGASYNLIPLGTVTDTGGGTLRGTGNLNLASVSVASGATLYPGNATTPAGILTATGQVSFEAGSAFRVFLTGGVTPDSGQSPTGASGTPGTNNNQLVSQAAAGSALSFASGAGVVVDVTAV